jgi:hypothetical protein
VPFKRTEVSFKLTEVPFKRTELLFKRTVVPFKRTVLPPHPRSCSQRKINYFILSLKTRRFFETSGTIYKSPVPSHETSVC